MREIARRLGISYSSVRYHMTALLDRGEIPPAYTRKTSRFRSGGGLAVRVRELHKAQVRLGRLRDVLAGLDEAQFAEIMRRAVVIGSFAGGVVAVLNARLTAPRSGSGHGEERQ